MLPHYLRQTGFLATRTGNPLTLTLFQCGNRQFASSVEGGRCQSLLHRKNKYAGHNVLNMRCKTRQIPQKPPTKTSRQLFWWSLVGCATCFAIGHVLQKEKQRQNEEEMQKQQGSYGDIDIGGPFELVNHDGETVTDETFKGRWMLMYFGFCHCPDICPEELERVCEVADAIEKKENVPNIIPLFISIDPERDTVSAVKEYVSEFSPKLIGLTGTPEQCKTAARAFRIYTSKGPVDKDGDYIVDHSIVMYLVNPEGKLINYFGRNTDTPKIVEKIAYDMVKYETSLVAKKK